jgi:hypothetical protein
LLVGCNGLQVWLPRGNYKGNPGLVKQAANLVKQGPLCVRAQRPLIETPGNIAREIVWQT